MSTTYAGKWHDTSLVDEVMYNLPVGSVLYRDMGFQGYTVVNATIQQPTKKRAVVNLHPNKSKKTAGLHVRKCG